MSESSVFLSIRLFTSNRSDRMILAYLALHAHMVTIVISDLGQTSGECIVVSKPPPLPPPPPPPPHMKPRNSYQQIRVFLQLSSYPTLDIRSTINIDSTFCTAA